MYSLAFPNMFSNKARTNLVADKAATMSNLKLLLKSDKNSLLGDPYYGTDLKSAIYMNKSVVLKDLLIDSICSSIRTFMPQVSLTRNDVDVYLDDDGMLQVEIAAKYNINGTPILYNIALMDTSEI